MLLLSPFALAACQTNQVTIGAHSTVQFGQVSGTPIGYFNLCKSGHAVCRRTAGRGVERQADGSIRLTAPLHAQLREVNRSVNQSIRPVADGISVGKRGDRWSVEPAAGDCEDFAITKKNRLLRAGWPSSALLLAIVKTRSGQDHAVLVVRTNEGDLVLDNLVPSLRSWGRSGYSGKSIQSPNDQWRWLSAA
jgi:predicted transglutaminase-like cysteine proteinase